MLLTSRFCVKFKETRMLYLSCLSCVVVLFLFFGFHLWSRLDLHSFNESHEKTQYETQSSLSSTSNDTGSKAASFHGRPHDFLKSKPSGSSQPRYAIILPTYSKHIPLAIDFFQSLMCLCTDYNEIDLHIIVSDSNEIEAFRNATKGLKSCGETYSIFKTPATNVNGPRPKLNIVNLYDILPTVFRSNYKGRISPNDTSVLLKEHGKFQYQTIKKLAAAVELKYDWGLWLDSEAIAVQPFSMRQAFETYIQKPTIWRSRMANTDFMRAMISNSARVLNREIESFGQAYWNLESVQWFFEKPIIDELVRYVEKTSKQDFWTTWVTRGGPFEVNLYNMHIQAQKLETTDPLFSKYMIVETEREMERFGMGPAKNIMDKMEGTGLLERGYKLLEVPEVASGFSSMLANYGQRLFRLDDLAIAPPEVLDQFLLDTPIDILCSGAPPLHSWWEKRQKSIR
ncbi:uncharacterized protein CTRU02_204349 [Colletotrichum truncatum]|uniref:Uncharacterized protein n=1 Tax=Colletotrichum truncatum TaxID=5467 RepID=A0ACC3ZBV8_COLTU|nr:uncharacterized protein CTRU02_13070 [Colletotrichum truncatum]KAF6783820.1 hypothetical protein CTRU02_13070 [Colletotrichum truncatum]